MTFHEIRQLLACDLERSKPISVLRTFKYLVSQHPRKLAAARIRIAHFLYYQGHRKVASRLLQGLMSRLGLHIGATSQIGPGLQLPHATSIVIGLDISIGRNCTIYQNTTLAGAPPNNERPFQRLGDNVTLYAGACVVGDGRVGNNVIIGANSVVNKAFGDNVILAGAPARIVKQLSGES